MLDKLLAEYRPTMPTEVLHLWAADAIAALRTQSAELTALKAKVEAFENRPVVAWMYEHPSQPTYGPDIERKAESFRRTLEKHGWTETPLVAKEA